MESLWLHFYYRASKNRSTFLFVNSLPALQALLEEILTSLKLFAGHTYVHSYVYAWQRDDGGTRGEIRPDRLYFPVWCVFSFLSHGVSDGIQVELFTSFAETSKQLGMMSYRSVIAA